MDNLKEVLQDIVQVSETDPNLSSKDVINHLIEELQK